MKKWMLMLGCVVGILLAWTFVRGILFPPLIGATVIDMRRWQWEIMTTDEGRQQGLSNRERLDDHDGMLFLFPEKGIYPFWMKDMRFDLDLIWLDGDRVVDVVTLPRFLRSDGTRSLWIARHVPLRPADRVMEINAGQAAAEGVKVGSRVLLP